jgi:glutathione peroxidase
MNQNMLSAQQEGGAKTAPAAAASVADAAKPPLDVAMKTLDGKDVNLAKKYEGKVVLLVNVASFCGNTKQYAPLQALHAKYAEQGLAIVGVPCNQFGRQEPGTSEEIAKFCETEFGVKFDLLSKVEVNGENACDLYKFLTSKEKNPKFGGNIPWNFEKFLFSRDGQVVARFNHRVSPDVPDVVKAIEAELAKKAPPKAATPTPSATAGAAGN